MKNVVDSIIASIIFALFSTGVGLILQALGFGAQESILAALFALLAFIIAFLLAKRHFPGYTRWLTERLLENALNIDTNETDEARTSFKKRIVERVLLESSGVELKRDSSVIEFLNQEVCEPHIREAFRNARKAKILTIRGEKYFLGRRSLLYDLYLSKQRAGFRIEVLVLSPESQHITNELAVKLGHDSAERIREKMRIVLNYLKLLADQDKIFTVKCYNDTPNFKILMFDDIMFVSTFAGGEPKNDSSAKMLQITREGNPLFISFERYFDDLSKRSVSSE